MRIGSIFLILLVVLIALGFLISDYLRICSESSGQEVAALVQQNTQLKQQVLALEQQLEQSKAENIVLREENDHLKSLLNNVDDKKLPYYNSIKLFFHSTGFVFLVLITVTQLTITYTIYRFRQRRSTSSNNNLLVHVTKKEIRDIINARRK